MGDIRAQLDYRAQNWDMLQNFRETRVIGSNWTVHIDDNQGLLFITRSRNWRSENPDLIRFDQITGCTVDIERNEDGTGVLSMAGESTDLTWQDGSLTTEGDTRTYVIAGGILTLDLSDGDEFVLLFKKGTKPSGSSSGGLKGLLGNAGADAAEEPETPPEEPAELPEAAPAAQGSAFEPVGGYIGDGYFEIIAAESFIDSNGKDAIRFYCDFTNTSDEVTSCWWECSFKAEQSGYQLVDAYANWEDDVPEYGNTSRSVLPGVTIRCIAEFSYQPAGGPVTFTIYDYDDHELTAVFDPSALPGRPETPVVSSYDSSFYADFSDYGETDAFTIYIDTAEYTEDYFGDDLIRVYFDYANNSDSEDTCYYAMNIYAFQNGVSLDSGYPDEELETDEQYDEYVQPGESLHCSNCWELVDYDAPIEIVVQDYILGVVAAAIFTQN